MPLAFSRILPLVLPLAPLLARADTFGALSFPPQTGSARISPYAVSYADLEASSFRIVTFFRESASSGDAGADSQAEWERRVERLLNGVGKASKTETVALPEGWTLSLTSAPIELPEGDYQVHLGVYSGHGVRAAARVVLKGRLDSKAPRPALFAQIKPVAPSAGPRPEPLNSGFTMAIPDGFEQVQQWRVKTLRASVGGRTTYTSALFRLLDPIKGEGDFGLALKELWNTSVPSGFVSSRVMFRRYVGAGLGSWFSAGLGRELGRNADTLFQLFLVNVGDVWQPIVIAQTYEDPDNPDAASVAAAGRESFAASGKMVEEILKDLSCTGVGGGPMALPEHLVGDYRFGSESGVDWVMNPIGPIPTKPATVGGTLSLKKDGTYERSEGGGPTEKGSWRIERDLLVLQSSSGSSRRLRIAAVTQFKTGERLLVLLPRLSDPVAPLVVSDASTYYLARPAR
ncbi:MAG: copper resistance protein NlpE [Fimbriimonadales bacterium]|nr:copper resistance protein NlpE [Fimbriimonadales bacterium]